MHEFRMMRIETPWGPWDAAPLDEVVALMRGLAAPWWVAGGYAIELAVGRAYREHGDVDIALLRRDQLAVRRLLNGWDVHAAVVPQTLRPWALDEVLPGQAHDIWVRVQGHAAEGRGRFRGGPPAAERQAAALAGRGAGDRAHHTSVVRAPVP